MKFRVFNKSNVLLTSLCGVIILGGAFCILSEGANARQETKNNELLEFIHAEAPQIDVFPLDYVVVGCLDSAIEEPFNYISRRQLTFERFKPVYRFKERVSVATQDEVDKCVAQIDELNPKEKALVLAAICQFERLRRPTRILEPPKYSVKQDATLANESEPSIDVRKWQSRFKSYEPDKKITATTWRRWKNCVEKYGNSNKIAFEVVTASNSEAKNERIVNEEKCVDILKSKLDPAFAWENWVELRRLDPSFIASHKPMELANLLYNPDEPLTLAFLEKVDAMERSAVASAEDVRELTMLREYLWMNRNFRPLTSDSAGRRRDASSGSPQTLGAVAARLSQYRIPYEIIK
ncbi:MAG: hypothetical protein J6X44_08265 [Thermoguttaceae bacterium]|nr:hypothetical protein [Thermoguttaceae bacterium]